MRKIKIENKEIFYTLRHSRRSKNISLAVNNQAEVTLSLPWNVPEKFGISFLARKAEWMLRKIDFYRNKKNPVPFANSSDYKKYKRLALEISKNKIEYFNAFYKYPIKKISIRNQKARWGSCSRNGNLNFSYRIIYLPEKLCDYVIVHELCHLGEFNHSQNFWALVEKIIPDCRKIKKEIKNF